jgi:hypothetical protein
MLQVIIVQMVLKLDGGTECAKRIISYPQATSGVGEKILSHLVLAVTELFCIQR